MKVRETRRICAGDVRALCTRQNWYTGGNNQEYEKMLVHAGTLVNVTAEDLLYLALDIKKHSFTERSLEGVCYELALMCFSTFEITYQRSTQ
ncbi:hypothetical protein [Phascolarctobacterium faecium]|uniref:hypothetical protein n=1 Tax=Phascolarctobacterium faecium TaxID=33025 RepID=UPI003FF03A06